jgi:hypothetical protein
MDCGMGRRQTEQPILAKESDRPTLIRSSKAVVAMTLLPLQQYPP